MAISRHPNDKSVRIEYRRVKLLGYWVTVCMTLRKGEPPFIHVSTYKKIKKKVKS